MAKEKIRFEENEKIQKFIDEANQERINREAIETGRRQAEKSIKAREKRLYSEVL